ncbi:MAG: hypothetical protein ACREC1_03340 [Methylovirgula sp.]
MKPLLVLLTAVAIAWGLPARAGPSILTYHGEAQRSGHFVVPGLTWDRARSLHLDPTFHAELSGRLYAQPLYWQPSDSGPALLIAVTQNNVVYALDAHTGHILWQRQLGTPVPLSSVPCGNILPPFGITGTPVIDAESETLFVDAAVTEPSGLHHLVFALALKDGTILPNWPVDVAGELAGKDPPFVASLENQRGALLIAGGTLYVPYGSFFDCRPYHGTVVGIPLSDPHKVMRWATRAMGGGVWAPGGIASDGTSLFLATGNTFDATDWADGEAVIRLPFDLQGPPDQGDFFTPTDWRDLDAQDSDLGGIAPLLIDVPDGNGRRPLVLALGKNGKAYLLDRTNLGGVGGALAVAQVSARGIFAAAAVYPAGDSVYVAFPGTGTSCAKGDSGLVVVAVRGGKPPTLATAWCASVEGWGAPIATTTDGHSNPIVWALGAEGDNRLHAFRGDTGEVLFSGPSLNGLRHFQTLIATQDRLYVGADGTIYAFAF